MATICQSAGLVDPRYEIGVSIPHNNKKQKHPKGHHKLPIPPQVIFSREFKAGETLPIFFKATGDIVELNADPQTITFIQDIFVRATKDQVTFSTNEKNWKPFSDLFTGAFNINAVQSVDDEMPHFVAEMNLNLR